MKVALPDIVREVSKATKLAIPDARKVVKRLVSTLVQGLLDGQRIEIRGFGVFQTKWVRGRKGRDIARNLSMYLPPFKKVSFKAGKGWKRPLPSPPEIAQPDVADNGQLEMPLLQEATHR